MASFRARYLAILAANERAMSQLFRDLAAGIAADVARRADGSTSSPTGDGVVPRTATFELQRQSAERIQRLYLGRNRAGELAPFEVMANGKVIPLAPYPQALWAAITAAVRLPVEENAAILTKRLPDDVLAVMRRGTVDPFKAAKGMVAEVEVFRPNVLATYDPPHTWVDPNGYRLSDRVWNTAATERAKLDAYLDDAIKQGKGALVMAKELQQFLDPSRAGLKTSKPYGTKASFDAMRLARTEITRAHGQAHVVAGAMNPFVAGDKWNLSSRHPKPDICDVYARGGPNGDGVYPTGTLPGYPPHPQCVTPGQMVSTASGPVAIEDIKVGDQVLTHMGRYRQVLSTWATPHNGLVYRFETEQGSFEVTGNHPVLLRSGWVNAEFVQPGNEILHAGLSATSDGDLVVSFNAPAGGEEKSGSPRISFHGAGDVVPIAITFDSDTNRRHGDIDEEFPDLELNFVGDALSIKGEVHCCFQRAGIGEPLLPAAEQHRHESWIRGPFSVRYLPGNIGASSGVFVASEISRQVDPRHGLGCFAASAPVVLLPTGSNGVTPVAHLDVTHGENGSQIAEVDSVFGKDLITREPLIDVDISHQGDDVFAGLCFEPADVALDSRHISLLLLSPESGWGARSGNLVVNRVITPVQAPHDYIRILTVSTCQYAGNVYNMTVADDHSYTVGGHVVHNCICNLTYAMIGDPDAVIDALRADIRRERADLVNKIGPLAVENFDRLLLGEALPAVVAQPAPVVVQPVPTAPTAPVEPTAAEARARLDRIYNEYDDKVAAESAIYQSYWIQIEPLYDQKADILTDYLKATTDHERGTLKIKEEAITERIAGLNAKRQVHIDNMNRLERERGPAMRASVHVLEPADNTVSWTGKPKAETQANWRSGMDAFNQLVRRDVWTNANVPIERLKKGGRPYHLRGTIHVSTNEDIGTMVHEIAHAFEQQSGVLPKVLAFYDKRTAGDPVEKLRNITGYKGYGDDEVARRDKWIEPYMGKDYKRRATELVSMGLEMLHNNPGKLARDDPEMFDFIFDLVRGR